MTPEQLAQAQTFACPVCAAQPTDPPCAHMAQRYDLWLSMQPAAAHPPTEAAFDKAAEESGLF